MKSLVTSYDFPFIRNGGAMGELTRNFDWSQTALGAPQSWPQSLRTTIGIVLHSKFPMFLFWGPQHICFYNDAYRPSLGIEGKHPGILGMQGEQAWPEIWDFIKPLIDQVLAGEDAVWFEDQFLPIFRNGHIENVYWTFSYSPVLDESNTIAGVLVTCSETTGKVNALKLIGESEERFRTMAEGSPILIAVGDETSHATYFNKGWTDLTGRPMQDLIDFGWLDLLHPDDRERYLTTYLEAFKNHSAFTGEFRVLNRQGEYCWVLAQNTPRFSEGTFLGFISACIDITERKRIETALERAYEQTRLSKDAAKVGTFDLDLEKQTMEWDRRCRNLFGIKHNEPVVYEKDFVLGLHPDDRERIIAAINEAFVKSISNGDYDVEYRTVGVSDQRIRWVRAKGKVYFDEHDKPLRFIGSVYDITKHANAMKRVEELVTERTKELADANTNLQKSNAELAQFAYIASHDLQEPLRKISTFSQLLQKNLGDDVNESTLNYLSKIRNATARMTTLIRDVLLYSQLSTERETFEDVNLNEVLSSVIADYDLLIEQLDATVQFDILPTIDAIPLQMTQLFANLLGNALKFSRKDVQPEVTISLEYLKGDVPEGHSLSPNLEYIRIRFTDNGIGIDPEYVGKIFNIFHRLHSKSEYEGTGIGLAMCKKIALNHKGAIYAESTNGFGTAFNIILPIKQSAIQP